MSNEKLDWKPEVGKTAWAINRRSLAVVECVINAIYGTEPYVVAGVSSRTRGGSWLDKAIIVYPTAEAALAANPLKVYDLEGKEVLIPHAAPDFSLDEMVDFFNKWIKIEGNMKLFLEAQGKPVFSSTIGKYMDRAKEIVDSEVQSLAFRFMLTDEEGHQNYTWEECLEMARREIEGRGANGEKSDQGEGGC